jgi:hypothetical protein
LLKRYETPERLQWVGRAWEIRHALRQEVKRRGGGARLTDMLSGRTGKSPARGKSQASLVRTPQKGAILRFPAP